MVSAINKMGGRIDHIFYCTDIDNNSINRKPQPGMALQAKEKFPSIDFTKSIMVGNRTSDMEFGRNAKMKTVFISDHPIKNSCIDFNFHSLIEFALSLQA